MAKWQVEASPNPSHPETTGAVAETHTFMTDKTPPGTRPSAKMDHGEALRWAHD
jgi:hypothetical protein